MATNYFSQPPLREKLCKAKTTALLSIFAHARIVFCWIADWLISTLKEKKTCLFVLEHIILPKKDLRSAVIGDGDGDSAASKNLVQKISVFLIKHSLLFSQFLSLFFLKCRSFGLMRILYVNNTLNTSFYFRYQQNTPMLFLSTPVKFLDK